MLAVAALAHVVQGVEGAYRRTDLFEERRTVMDAWGVTSGPKAGPEASSERSVSASGHPARGGWT